MNRRGKRDADRWKRRDYLALVGTVADRVFA
jgi:hypothetical protein